MKYEFIQSLLILSAAILSFGYAIYFSKYIKTFIKNSLKTQARVKDVERVKGDKGAINFNILVSFNDQDGKEITAKIKKASLQKKTCSVGDMLEVLYLKNDSQQVKTSYVAPFFQMINALFGGSLVLTLIAIYFAVMGLK